MSRAWGWIVASAATASWLVPGATAPKPLLASAIVAWLWALSTALGALLVDMMLEACGGTWQLPGRPALDALSSLLPGLSLIGVGGLLAGALAGASSAAGSGGHPLRLAASVGILGLISADAMLLGWLSRRQDLDPDPRWSRWRSRLACGSLPAVAILACLLAVTWYRSCSDFSSSVFGPLMVTSGMLAGTASWAIIAAGVARREPGHITSCHLVAIGRLLLALILITAYLAFSQLIIDWMGDLPGEATWWLPRLHGSAGLTGAVLLIICGGCFLALLSQDLKRHPLALALVCGLLVLLHAGFLWWTVMPALRQAGAGTAIGWLDAAGILCMGCWGMLWLSRRPLGRVIRHLPGMERGLAYSDQLG